MSTSGGFTPPQAAPIPECAYAPRMTRAAVLALRAAAGLQENCVVVITDGPTIGNGTVTSATEIELNPTGPSELGLAARVHTTFDDSAWAGLYDIDLGTAGSIVRLTDNRNNTIIDSDANSPAVHTQFPWGQGTVNQIRDNYLDDISWTQPSPLLAGFAFTDNVAQNAQFDFTGLTTNFLSITNNEFRTAKLVASATSTGVANVSRLKLTGVLASTAYLTLAQTGTGGATIRGVEINESLVTISHPSGTASITDSLVKGGAGVVTLAAAATISDSVLTNALVNFQTGSTGTNSISRATVNGGTITKTTGASGPLSFSYTNMDNGTITIGATNAATTNTFQNADIQGGVFVLNGPIAGGGRNDFTNGVKFAGCGVTVAATATAGIAFNNGWLEGATINQNRTAGTGSTTFFDASLRGFTTFTDNGTTDPGVGMSFNRVTAVDSTITLGNVTGKTGTGTILQQIDLIGSTLTLVGPNGPASATDFLNRVRLAGASLTNAGFGCTDVIIDGAFTKTLTAYNSNRLVNKSFDDLV